MSTLIQAPAQLLLLRLSGLDSLENSYLRLVNRPMTLADMLTGVPTIIRDTFPWDSLKEARTFVRELAKEHGTDAVFTNGDSTRPDDFPLSEVQQQLDNLAERVAPLKKLMKEAA